MRNSQRLEAAPCGLATRDAQFAVAHCFTGHWAVWGQPFILKKNFFNMHRFLSYLFVTALLLLCALVFWLQGTWDPSSLTRGWTPHLLQWKVKARPLDLQGSPPLLF